MTTALIERDPAAPAVTNDQLELIKRTVATGATADELKLYLYDCARQGVHPLDKLIHFTKRGGKYTPVTSIDFMRIRAAETNEYAGSDDAVFAGLPPMSEAFAATVTVWRLTQGQRFPYTGTARWSEYKPAEDFMWRKMPHTMLAKCAEAVALRKGFPRQLAGLYAKEEMDQADSPRGYVVEAPAPSAAIPPHGEERRENPPVQRGGDAGPTAPPANLPAGAVVITKVEPGWPGGKAKGFLFHSGQMAGDDGIAIYEDQLKALADELCQLREPVTLETKLPASGKAYVKTIQRVSTDSPF